MEILKQGKVKFLHIFLHDGLGFVSKYIDMLNNEHEFFNKDEHLFLTNQPRIYETLKHYENIYFVEDAKSINKYGDLGEWIIIHALNLSIIQLLSIKRKYAKKIIWRTWGHDVKVLPYKNNLLKNIVKLVYNFLYRNKIKQFYAVGCASDVDVVKIKSFFGNIRTVRIHYSFVKNRLNNLQSIFDNMHQSDCLKVLLGHSGCDTDNHIELLYKLKPYKDENMQIFLPLTYGDSKYINQVISTAKNIFAEKVTVIDKHIPYYDYAKFISGIDVAIMDQTHSAALGNINLLAFFKKKIFVNKNGDLAKALLDKNCEVYTTEDIGKISFDSFSSNDELNSSKIKALVGRVLSNSEFCQNNKLVFDSLNK